MQLNIAAISVKFLLDFERCVAWLCLNQNVEVQNKYRYCSQFLHHHLENFQCAYYKVGIGALHSHQHDIKANLNLAVNEH